MPARNTLKVDVDDSYYHVYSRGVAKQPIFIDDEDYHYFRSLFARYLSLEAQASSQHAYPHLRDTVELLAYCQMGNHFHLLMYQRDKGALLSLMRGVMTAYSKYFNRKYSRSGPVFESRYKAVRITNDQHLYHISRYIHLNPRRYLRYNHSSYLVYVAKASSPEWLQPERIQEMFDYSVPQYTAFCADYVERRDLLAEIKDTLADR